MTYKILSQSLWPLAEAVRKYLKDDRGLTSIKKEKEIKKDVPVPILHAVASDQSIICVDFLEDACFGPNVQTFVNRCKAQQVPARLYVAFPEASENSSFGKDLRTARELGVGVMSISPGGSVTIVNEAISLVLSDVRRPDPREFPPKYRSDLAQAYQTYLQGNPVKGSLGIYEMIEALTRRIARKLHKRKLIAPWIQKAPKFDKDPWFNIADAIYKHLTFQKAPKLTQPLWAQVIAVTRPRNEAGHEPKTMGERAKRDKELRTRFETAADLLRNLTEATEKWKV